MNYAIKYGYTDVYAFEVVKRVSEKTIEVRELEATLLNGVNSGKPDALTFSAGGFMGHTEGTQRYSFSSNSANPVIRIRLNKKGQWKSADGAKFKLVEKPYKFHDYNF